MNAGKRRYFCELSAQARKPTKWPIRGAVILKNIGSSHVSLRGRRLKGKEKARQARHM